MSEWPCPKCSFLAKGLVCEICGHSITSKLKGKKRFIKIESDFFTGPTASSAVVFIFQVIIIVLIISTIIANFICIYVYI